MKALFSWLSVPEVFGVSCGLGVVEAWVSHTDDQLWLLFLYS